MQQASCFQAASCAESFERPPVHCRRVITTTSSFPLAMSQTLHLNPIRSNYKPKVAIYVDVHCFQRPGFPSGSASEWYKLHQASQRGKQLRKKRSHVRAELLESCDFPCFSQRTISTSSSSKEISDSQQDISAPTAAGNTGAASPMS